MSLNSSRGRRIDVAGLLHRHLLKGIVLSYVLAAAWPGPGLWIRETRLLDLAWTTVTLPTFLLATLVFQAGLRVNGERARQIAARPAMMLAGLAANVAVPLTFLAALVPTLRYWHNPEEAAMILIGLALVTAMPIAGSSTGWSQAAGGDLALSLALVLVSTLLSPLTTPTALRTLALLAEGTPGAELHRLAGRGTGSFLAAWVLLPSLVGMAVRGALGADRTRLLEGRLKPVAPATLMVLCYANASVCLPRVLGDPDWDFLAVTLVLVAALCVLTFAAGGLLARLLGADPGQRAALMFGLGMNNNGTGLVLAALALGSRPLALLPILVYNLVQHLVAGCVDAFLKRGQARSS
jgi:BASS family bile acid:Na+ symporter